VSPRLLLVCWCYRHSWFDGFKPADKTRVHAEVVDADVLEARRVIYKRKVEISAAIRAD
jgi:hypothetical protein